MKMMQLSQVGVYVMALGLAATAFALDGSWNVDASGSWTNELNWLSNQTADGAGYTATFNIPMAANRAITLHRDQTIGNLLFGAEGLNNRMLSNSELLINGSPKKLNLDNGVMVPLITCWALAPVNSACRISTPIASPLGFIKNGNGTLWLNAANPSLAGTIELRQGRIFAQTASTAFGTASVVVSNTCYLSFWAGGTYTNAFEFNGPGTTIEGQRKWTLTADNSTDLTLTGPIQLNGLSEFGINAGNTSKTIFGNGPISGPGGLVLAGNGRVILSGPKEFSGGIVVSNTCVLLFGNSTNCLGAPLNKTNLITVLPGAAFDLSGRNLSTYYPASQGYTITASGYGSNPNYTNTYGTIYGAIVSTGLNNSNQGVPNLNMVGDTWIGNKDNKFYLAGKVSGPYSLIQVGNGILVNQGSFADDVKALIVSNGTFTSIQPIGKADVAVYSGAVFGQWGTRTLTGSLTMNDGATFRCDSGNTTWSGSVSLNGASTFNAGGASQAMTISGNMAGEGAFVKIGAGKLVLSGTNTFSGSMWVTNGIVQINSTNSLPTTADLYLYTASTNAPTPLAQLNLNYEGVRAVRRFYIDDELQTRNKIYHESNSKLTLTGLGMICPIEGTNPKGTIVRFY